MKPAPFEYVAIDRVDECVALLDEFGDDCKILAGGQSLVPLLNFRLARPAVLIDINPLADLAYIRSDGTELRIGAMVRQRTLQSSEDLRGGWGLLRAALDHVGHAQTRNRGTIGGSLAHADPAAELGAAAAALGAKVVAYGPRGTREFGAADFFTSVFTTALDPRELLVEVRVPRWPERAGVSFQEVSRRAGDFALVGVGAVVALDSAGNVERCGLGVCGVGEKPLDASAEVQHLSGLPLTQSAVSEVAEAVSAKAAESVDATSARYRRELVKTLTARALTDAAARAVRAN